MGLAFLLLFGFLLGLHGCIILGHVEDVDVLPVAKGLQQAEEGNGRVPSEERIEAVKHHSHAAVAQLKPERTGAVTMATGPSVLRRAACSSASAFTGAAVWSRKPTEPR